MTKVYLFSAIATTAIFFAQNTKIDTVFIDHQIQNSYKFGKVQKISSQELLKNSASLSDVLMFQTPVYIKENGRGMVSSPAFRGTTSQQTAFLWNGINVNSQFLGQGDINNISLLSFDNIDVKYGGGSVIYGSGAIGGSIHLNNELLYNKDFNNKVFLEYGSFNTFTSYYKTSFSKKNFGVNFSINQASSDNDYEVENKSYINRNGAYKNITFSLGAGYKINHQNELFLQSQWFDSQQNYPILSAYATPTQYKNENYRGLVGWKMKQDKSINDFKLAFLQDEFQYFSELGKAKSSSGTTTQFIVKNDFNYKINEKGKLNIITEFNHTQGKGFGSGIDAVDRNQLSFGALYRHQSSDKLYLELGAKKDFVEKIVSPFMYSAAANYLLKDWYEIKLSVSKNFRFPSFNDLYWQPGGNLDLKPETSHQIEMQHQFKFQNFKLGISPYYILINDMIRWLPSGLSYWLPVNTHKVRSFGIETSLNYKKTFGDWVWDSNLIYAFTNSQNRDTKMQLMYVPKHKSTFNSQLKYKKINLFAQTLFNGKTFVDSEENNKTAINAYVVVNAGLRYEIINGIELGIKINNITNQIYLTTEAYYMPLRNYSANLLFNF